jgi:GAF domain-containing protein/HAMP domain-containing protein
MEAPAMSERRPPAQPPELVRTYKGHQASLQSGAGAATSSLRLRMVAIFLLAALAPAGLFVAFLFLINQNLWVNILLSAIFIIVISSILAKILNQQVITPIMQLAKVVEKVAGGSLWEKAPEGRNEIGQLGRKFNIMTTELRMTLHDLERRNAERASELDRASQEISYRATQLQTVTEVARAIASVQDPDLLLQKVTQLISERFKFYHVGIFLLDRKAEYAILQAANSEGGQRMLERGHRLKVGGESVIGYAAKEGEPGVAHRDGKDPAESDNPDLPYTRSELAIPLKAAEKVTGVLDVQSMEQSAFTQDDISLLSTLADQVAVAIENVRLYTETRKTLAELESTHRQYLQERWTQLTDERREKGYEYRYGKVQSLPENEPSIDINEPETHSNPVYLLDSSKVSEQPLRENEVIVPITVRGQWIGSLQLGEEQQSRTWSEEDLHLIRAVADQVGQALENSRLLEETQRRAEREHLVSEITTKLRASNDPQVILQTAMKELREALRVKRTHFIEPPAIPNSEAEVEAVRGSNRTTKELQDGEGV